jgi:hypothetical protein
LDQIVFKVLTDVHDMPFAVDHDVTVMPILDLEDVARDRVRGHRLDKVEAGFLEGYRINATVLVDKVREEVVDLGSTHLVSGRRVGDNVDDTALASCVSNGLRYGKGCKTRSTHSWSSRGNTVRKQIQHQSNRGEDVLEHGDDLQRQDVLPTIVADFEDGRLPYFVFGLDHLGFVGDLDRRVGRKVNLLFLNLE